MLEIENIQSRGFNNVSEKGKVTGFQVPFRSSYYRGVWLSQLLEATVTIDGEKFSGDQITWTIGGKTYAQSELANNSEVHWALYEPAVLTVKKPGGLSLDVHEVEVTYGYTTSYMRAADNWISNASFKRKMTLAK